MRVFAALAMTGIALSASALAATRYIETELVSESAQPRPGQSVLIGLRMTPKPGWHSYWSNPGEAGFPTAVEWKAPAGVRFGPLQYPAPTMLRVAGMVSYVHAGPHVLVSRMSLDRDIQPGTPIPVTAEVSWAACSDKLCVPQRATLTLNMTAGSGERSENASLLHEALARQPKAGGRGAFDVEDGSLLMQLPDGVRLNAARAQFFPDENGVLDSARQRAIVGVPLRITTPIIGTAPWSLTGVVSDGSAAYRVTFERKALAPSAIPLAKAETQLIKADKPRTDPAPAIPDHAAANVGPPATTMNDRSWWAWIAIGLGALAASAVWVRSRRSRR